MSDDRALLRGSGNVFADAGDPDAQVKHLKAQVAADIIATLNRRGLGVDQAADAAGVAPGRDSAHPQCRSVRLHPGSPDACGRAARPPR